jgi:hypothetical protein
VTAPSVAAAASDPRKDADSAAADRQSLDDKLKVLCTGLGHEDNGMYPTLSPGGALYTEEGQSETADDY